MTKVQQRRTNLKARRTLIWESQKPINIDIPNKMGIIHSVFVGFSKGKTYIKSIHGPIGSSVKN